MATPTKPTPKPKPSASYVNQGSSKRRLGTGAIVGIAVGAVVLLAALVAIVTNLGGSDSSSASAGEVQDVTWSGNALPPEPENPGDVDQAIGIVAPTVSGSSFDGTPITIDPTTGTWKMLVFVAHWCPHCQAEVPRIVAWQAGGGKPDNLDIYAIATGTDKTLPNYPPSAWLEREGWTNPVLVDGPGNKNFQASQAFGLRSYPYVVIIGPDGKVKARHSGEFADGELQSFVTGAMAKA